VGKGVKDNQQKPKARGAPPPQRKKKKGKKISLQVDMDLVLDVAMRKEVYTLKRISK